jgi:GAF domain-containing protein
MKRTRKLLAQDSIGIIDDFTVFKTVCQDIADNIDCDLVSVWFFPEEDDCLECKCVYKITENTYDSGQRLMKKDYPVYFKNLIENTFVSAPTAQTHFATKEFAESYFNPNGVISMLDFILHKDFKAVGVICCENRKGIRHWTQSDRDYLLKIATLVSGRFIS